jgi:hypothetical protein
MELTIASVIAFVTLIVGEITKKFGLVNKKYIPVQSVVIGLVSGVICYVTNLEPNIINAIITCLISSLSASGLYDVIEVKTKG